MTQPRPIRRGELPFAADCQRQSALRRGDPERLEFLVIYGEINGDYGVMGIQPTKIGILEHNGKIIGIIMVSWDIIGI